MLLDSKKDIFPEAHNSDISRPIMNIVDGIDRTKLLSDHRLARARHPLVQERIGEQLALNVEVHNMVYHIASSVNLPDGISNADQVLEWGRESEAILLDNALDRKSLIQYIQSLKTAVVALAQKYEENEKFSGNASRAVDFELRIFLKMPTNAKDLVVYSFARSGEDPQKALDRLLSMRERAANLICETPENASRIREFEDEHEAVERWLRGQLAAVELDV